MVAFGPKYKKENKLKLSIDIKGLESLSVAECGKEIARRHRAVCNDMLRSDNPDIRDKAQSYLEFLNDKENENT